MPIATARPVEIFPADLLGSVGGSPEVGEIVVGIFRSLCDLQPNERILDVGCGVGRIAVALTQFLGPEARYEGFDPNATSIDWCQKYITSAYPNFGFQHANLYCPINNPHGPRTASSYTFPYADTSFDFVFLNSVFTHMLPWDIERYMQEIARVLKPGGRCYSTYFFRPDERILREEEVIVQLDEGATQRLSSFPRYASFSILREDCPEWMVVYEEEFILRLYERFGLSLRPPIYRGHWSGRTPSLSGGDNFQDLIIATKG
ncbi:MAG: methyltransferase domain-containing protein [Candidatus Peregrinibacteria bacterium]|nr:methyltransferase domain-containing protein [Candidatus Peregrinibacteria bacterium]